MYEGLIILEIDVRKIMLATCVKAPIQRKHKVFKSLEIILRIAIIIQYTLQYLL